MWCGTCFGEENVALGGDDESHRLGEIPNGILKERSQREKQDYVGKVPKQEGGSDPNPLLDVYLPSNFLCSVQYSMGTGYKSYEIYVQCFWCQSEFPTVLSAH